MTAAKKIFIASAVSAGSGVVVLAANISYMYDVLGRCIDAKQCDAYPYWDIVNVGGLVLLGAAPLLLIIGLIVSIRTKKTAPPAE